RQASRLGESRIAGAMVAPPAADAVAAVALLGLMRGLACGGGGLGDRVCGSLRTGAGVTALSPGPPGAQAAIDADGQNQDDTRDRAEDHEDVTGYKGACPSGDGICNRIHLGWLTGRCWICFVLGNAVGVEPEA